MIVLLAMVGASHLALGAYFAWRFWLYRRPPSLLCAVLPLGWVFFVAQAAGWLPHNLTSSLLSVGLVLGVFGVSVITIFEANQPEPFR